jgi:hypothetical protein
VVETQPTLPPAAGAECSALLPTCHVPNAGAPASLRPRGACCRVEAGQEGGPANWTIRSSVSGGGDCSRCQLAEVTPQSRPSSTIGAPTVTRKPAARTISAIASCMRSRCSTRAGRSVRRTIDVTFSPSGLTRLRGGTRSALAPRWATRPRRPGPRSTRRLLHQRRDSPERRLLVGYALHFRARVGVADGRAPHKFGELRNGPLGLGRQRLGLVPRRPQQPSYAPADHDRAPHGRADTELATGAPRWRRWRRSNRRSGMTALRGVRMQRRHRRRRVAASLPGRRPKPWRPTQRRRARSRRPGC